MKLIINGSNSKGNNYVLVSDSGEKLIIEAGIKLMELKQSLNFKIENISGVIISHFHLDHFKYADEYVKIGIKAYANKETIIKSNLPNKEIFYTELIDKKQVKIGSYTVIPFPLKHDVKTFGFLIQHEEMGKVVFMTDTYYSPFKFQGVNNWIIEANYSEKILAEKESNGISYVTDRVRRSHLSVENCIKTLEANDLSLTNNIVLIHLSDSNSDEKLFHKMVSEATNKNVTVADKGVVIEFNKYSF